MSQVIQNYATALPTLICPALGYILSFIRLYLARVCSSSSSQGMSDGFPFARWFNEDLNQIKGR